MLAEPERWTDRYIGKTLRTSDGETAGSVEALILNRLSEVPEWFVVGAGLLGRQRYIVPVAGSEFSDDGVSVPYTSTAILGQPETANNDELSSEEETSLSDHFGLGAHEDAGRTT